MEHLPIEGLTLHSPTQWSPASSKPGSSRGTREAASRKAIFSESSEGHLEVNRLRHAISRPVRQQTRRDTNFFRNMKHIWRYLSLQQQGAGHLKQAMSPSLEYTYGPVLYTELDWLAATVSLVASLSFHNFNSGSADECSLRDARLVVVDCRTRISSVAIPRAIRGAQVRYCVAHKQGEGFWRRVESQGAREGCVRRWGGVDLLVNEAVSGQCEPTGAKDTRSG